MRSIRTATTGERGFTLVEIAVAVAILGIALTTLVGLHSRMLDTYINERNRTKASFVAQYVMTMVEVATDPPEVGSKEEDLAAELDSIGYFDGTERQEDKKSFEGWRIQQEVTSVDIPGYEDALRRVDLTISWGPTEDASFTLVYFASPSETPQQGGLGGNQTGTGTFGGATPGTP